MARALAAGARHDGRPFVLDGTEVDDAGSVRDRRVLPLLSPGRERAPLAGVVS